MPGYRAEPTRPDKAKAAAGVALVYATVVGAALMMPRDAPLRQSQSEPTVLIDVIEPPKPQPPPEQEAGKVEEEEGAAGRKAEPTPIVAPEPKLPAKTPVAAAPLAGTGSAPSAGAATAGTGPGAGGSGTGRGGGGSGGGGGIGVEARLLGGNSSRLPSSLLRGFAADRGYGHLLLTVAESGRVTGCGVLQSTGNGQVDSALCSLMVRHSRWSPARDRQGNPISVKVRYTATWSKD